MSRPHSEFFFAQALPWTGDCRLSQRVDLRWKLLSANASTGELTALVRFPAHWRAEVEDAFEEEIYVLDGALEIGETTLARDGYGRLPAGRANHWRSRKGAVVLIFLNSAPLAGSDESARTPPVFIDTTRIPWDDTGVLPEIRYMRLARKALHWDTPSGAHRTWLLSVAPQIAPVGAQLARETHGCAEEMFMLAGDITGPEGVMSPGAYFWRPAETLHGPFGSRQGGLALLRFRDGDQTVTFHELTLPFQFEAPYAPRLPRDLAYLTKARRAAGGRY